MMPILELHIKPMDEIPHTDVNAHPINDTLAIYNKEGKYLISSAEHTIPLQDESTLISEHFILKISLRNNAAPTVADDLIQSDAHTHLNSDYAIENALAFLYEQDNSFREEFANKYSSKTDKPVAITKYGQSLSLLNEYFQPLIPHCPVNISEFATNTALTISNGNILRDLGWWSEQETHSDIQKYRNFLQQPTTTYLGYQDD